MTIKKILIILLLLSCISLLGNDKLKELRAEYETAVKPGEKIGALIRMAQITRVSNPIQCRTYASEIIELSRGIKDQQREAVGLRLMGLGEAQLGNQKEALQYHYQALAIFKKLNTTGGVLATSVSIGNIFYYYGEYKKAVTHFERGLELVRKSPKKINIAVIRNNMGSIYLEWGQYDKALECWLEALSIKNELPASPASIARTLSNLGIVYKFLEQYEKGLAYFREALEKFRAVGDKNGIAMALSNTAQIYSRQGKHLEALTCSRQSLELRREIKDQKGIGTVLENIAGSHLALKDYDKALQLAREALQNHKASGNKMNIASVLLKIGHIHYETKQYDSALEYLEKSLAPALEMGKGETVKSCYSAFSEIYSTLGDHKKALEYHKKYVETKERLFNPVVGDEINKIWMKYETVKTRKVISKIKKSSKMKIIIFSLIGGISLIIALLVFFNRARLKKNARLMLLEKERVIDKQEHKLTQVEGDLKDYYRQKNRKKYEQSLLTEEQIDDYVQRIETLMKEEKPYLESDLTLKKTAAMLSIHSKALSQVLNERMGRNFKEYINHHRVNEAMALLEQSLRDKELSILHIAYDVGFNAKSSFNTVFKNQTGMTPSAYRKKLAEERPHDGRH
ncbi:MAG: AraC family transcriptional regulator [bacterium]|nr:AraC family transcriptional regulator [bacterium]